MNRAHVLETFTTVQKAIQAYEAKGFRYIPGNVRDGESRTLLGGDFRNPIMARVEHAPAGNGDGYVVKEFVGDRASNTWVPA